MLTSRLITEIIENHSKVSGCVNRCKKFVSKSILINHEITSDTLWAMPPSCTHSPVSLFLPKIHQNESNTFSKLFLLQCIFLWLPMVSMPLHKGDLRNPHCLSVGSDPLYLQVKPTIWAQSYPRKHTNCTTPLQERYFPTPLRHGMQKNSHCIETEQRYLCRVIHFNRQNLMLISPPHGTYWKYPTEY